MQKLVASLGKWKYQLEPKFVFDMLMNTWQNIGHQIEKAHTNPIKPQSKIVSLRLQRWLALCYSTGIEKFFHVYSQVVSLSKDMSFLHFQWREEEFLSIKSKEAWKKFDLEPTRRKIWWILRLFGMLVGLHLR